MNSLIGTSYNEIKGYTGKVIYDDSERFEFEYKYKSGCSYAVKINKQSNIIESWRFTAPRNLCDNNYFPAI